MGSNAHQLGASVCRTVLQLGKANTESDEVDHETLYTLTDVLGLGFEATCTAADGTRFLWHGCYGLRMDPTSERTILVTDTAGLPESPWTPTAWGREELEQWGAAT
jgi:hypothetical protein